MRSRTMLVVALGAVATLVAACYGGIPEAGPALDVPPDLIELDGVEIEEYEGERLDSVNDFRENSIRGVQTIDRLEYRLHVTGLVDEPAEYTISEITSGFPSYEKVVQLDCVEGWSAKVLWRGVLVRDVLDASGVAADAKSVIFTAEDGYSTSMPLEYFYDNDILMAYMINGVTMPPERGYPFQLVAESKWGYKWCKWITGIELSAEEDPGGYWEDRGYNNSGDRDRVFYGS